MNDLLALFCLKSAWSACRWGWLSIFFTSSRTRKFSACFTTACGNPDTLKSMSVSSHCVNKPMDCSLSMGLYVLTGSASSSWSTRSTDTGTQLFTSPCSYIGAFAVKQDTFVDFLSPRTGRLFCHNRSPCSMNWIRVWLGWLGGFWLSSNFWTQFLHPIIFQGKIRRRWRKNFLVYNFSNFHHDSLQDTISWECVVKDDCVRSCLIELKSFLLSKFYVDPIHRVLMFLPRFLLVPCNTRCFQVNYIFDICVLCS